MAVVAMVVVAAAATMGHAHAQGINADLISCDASNPNQQWMYHPGSDNHIVLKHNGWCLDVEDYGTTPGKACHRSIVWAWAMPDSERSHTSTPPAVRLQCVDLSVPSKRQEPCAPEPGMANEERW